MDIKLFVLGLLIYIALSSMCMYLIYGIWIELRRVTGYKKPSKVKREYI